MNGKDNEHETEMWAEEHETEMWAEEHETEMWAELTASEFDRRWFFARTAALALSAGALATPAAAGIRRGAELAAKIPKTFVYSMSGPMESFNPGGAAQNALAGLFAWTACYDTLTTWLLPPDLADTKKILARSGLNGMAKPRLATWEVSRDQKTYRFHLRKGVKSQYGNELSADDVLWSLQKWFLTATGKFQLNVAGLPSPDGVVKIDDKTVEFRLPAPGSILVWLGDEHFVVYDSTEARKHATSADPGADSWLNGHTAGYGPYKLTLYTPGGDRMAFQRRDDYWGEPPAVKRFLVQSVPEGGNRLALLLSGLAQYAGELTPLQYELVAKRGFKVIHFDTTTATSMTLTQTPPWNNPRVRQAIARAIPYQDILKAVYRGQAKPYKSILAPFIEGYTDKFWHYNTDYKAASAVLAPLKQTLQLVIVAGLPADQQVAILIRDGLRRAGVKVNIQPVTPAVYSAQRRTGAFQSILLSSAVPSVPTPDYYFFVYGGDGGFFNFYKYSNPKLEAAIQGSKSANRRIRLAAITDGQRIFMEDLALIPIAYIGRNHAVAPFVDIPFAHSASGTIHWRDFTIV